MTVVRPAVRRLVRALGIFVALPLGVLLLPLAACQGRLIYHPTRYPAGSLERLPAGVGLLRYRTGEGEQAAFYRAPRLGGDPKRVWMLFSGNAGTALGWLDQLAFLDDPAAGYLLFDYPGYGANEGSCTPDRILEASQAAAAALAQRLGWDAATLASRLGVAGHSLGTATALQFAARQPVRAVVLAAPFTDMVEMGHRTLVWPLGQLIWHRFDNRARLAEVLARTPQPQVNILHGAEDALIPAAMGRELADAHPGRVAFSLVVGAGHDEVVVDLLRALASERRSMRGVRLDR